MENQVIQEFVNNLSNSIEQIQSTIANLNGITADLKLQVAEQQKKLGQYSSQSEVVFDSINKFTETISGQMDELKRNFEDLTSKHDDNTRQISEWTEKLKHTLESMTGTVSGLQEEYQVFMNSSTEKVKGYQGQIETSYEAWKSKSEKLLKDIDGRISDIGRKVTVEMESAALIMSKKLEPTLHNLILAFYETKVQLRSTRITMVVISLFAISITVLAILVSFDVVQFAW